MKECFSYQFKSKITSFEFSIHPQSIHCFAPVGVKKVFCKQYRLSQISIPDLASYLLQSFRPRARLGSTDQPPICCFSYRSMHCICRAAATRYQIISKSNFWQIQSNWWWKASSVMELTSRHPQTRGQVDRHWVHTQTLAVSCTLLCRLPLSPPARVFESDPLSQGADGEIVCDWDENILSDFLQMGSTEF